MIKAAQEVFSCPLETGCIDMIKLNQTFNMYAGIKMRATNSLFFNED